MSLRTLTRSMLAAAAVVAVSTSAQAQVSNLSQTVTLQSGGVGTTVNLFTFEVMSGGLFRVYTDGPTVDPILFLFAGPSDALGARLAVNDDGCRQAFCAAAGAWYNSLVEMNLAAGVYTAGGTDLRGGSEANVRAGFNPDVRATGTFAINVVALDGGTLASNVTTTPEPATVALLGTGLLGVGAIARRRRALRG